MKIEDLFFKCNFVIEVTELITKITQINYQIN